MTKSFSRYSPFILCVLFLSGCARIASESVIVATRGGSTDDGSVNEVTRTSSGSTSDVLAERQGTGALMRVTWNYSSPAERSSGQSQEMVQVYRQVKLLEQQAYGEWEPVAIVPAESRELLDGGLFSSVRDTDALVKYKVCVVGQECLESLTAPPVETPKSEKLYVSAAAVSRFNMYSGFYSIAENLFERSLTQVKSLLVKMNSHSFLSSVIGQSPSPHMLSTDNPFSAQYVAPNRYPKLGFFSRNIHRVGNDYWLFFGKGGQEQPMNSILKLDVADLRKGGAGFGVVKAENNGGVGAVGQDYPSARYDVASVKVGDNIYFFGGAEVTSDTDFQTIMNGVREGQSGELWKFNVPTQTWTRLTENDGGGELEPGVQVPLRRQGALMFHRNDDLYLFGGYLRYLNHGNASGAARYLNDLWKYSISQNVWQLVLDDNTGGTGWPARRSRALHAVVGDHLYILGGRNSNTIFSDIWKVSLDQPTQFVNVGTMGVANKRAESNVFVSGSKIIGYGGVYADNGAGSITNHNDVFEYDTETNSFNIIQPSVIITDENRDVTPSKRRLHNVVADPEKPNQALIIAGIDTSSKLQDVWSFNYNAIDADIPRYVKLYNDVQTPTVAVSNFYERDYAGLASSANYVYVFGGTSSSFLNDVYRFHKADRVWTRVITTGATVLPRNNHAFFRMSQEGDEVTFVTFGGCSSGGCAGTGSRRDIFKLVINEAANTAVWQAVIPAGGSPLPPGRAGSYWAFHENNLYVFGGLAGINTSEAANWFNDFWKFNFETNVWSQIDLGANAPSPRDGGKMEIVGEKIFIIGGRGDLNGRVRTTAPMNNDIFVYDLNEPENGFVEITYSSNVSFPELSLFGSAVSNGNIYIFGGKTPVAALNNFLWMFNPATNSMRLIRDNVPSLSYISDLNGPPSPRFGLSMTSYDDTLYVFGGVWNMTSNPWLKSNELYSIRTDFDQPSNSFNVLVQVKANLPTGAIYSRDGKLSLSIGSGGVAGNGQLVHGADVYVYHPVEQRFMFIGTHSAASMTDAPFEAYVSPGLRVQETEGSSVNSNLYFLVVGKHGPGVTQPAYLDIHAGKSSYAVTYKLPASYSLPDNVQPSQIPNLPANYLEYQNPLLRVGDEIGGGLDEVSVGF